MCTGEIKLGYINMPNVCFLCLPGIKGLTSESRLVTFILL